MRKILSLLLCLVLCLSLLPMAVLADEDVPAASEPPSETYPPSQYFPVEGEFGDGLYWKVDGGTLFISGEGDMPEDSGSPWRHWLEEINVVDLGPGITGLNVAELRSFPNLCLLAVTDSVRSIDDGAFSGMDSLTEFEVHPARTGGLRIGTGAFLGCENLRSVRIEGKVESIGAGAFSLCPSLERVWVIGTVRVIEQDAFSGIPQSIEIIFEGDAPAFMGDVLRGSRATVSIPAENGTWTDDVLQAYGGYVTWTCNGEIIKVCEPAPTDPPVITDPPVPTESPAPTETPAPTQPPAPPLSGDFGDGLHWAVNDGVLVISGEGAMPEYTYNNYHDVPWSFWNDAITDVIVEAGVTDISAYAFRKLTNLESLTLSDTVTSIGSHDFYGCKNLKSLTITASGRGGVMTIGESAFYECVRLESLSIEGEIKSISHTAFYLCTRLESLDISGAVGIIEHGAFYECTGLKDIVISGKVTKIDESAFYNCLGLQAVTISGAVREIGRSAFYECKRLSSVTISGTVDVIDESVFYQCAGLKTVTIAGNVGTIRSGAFCRCTGLETIEFMDSAPTFEDNAFYGVTATVIIPEGNNSWPTLIMQDYGGSLTWVCNGEIIKEPENPPQPTETVTDSGDFGDGLHWALDNGVLTISGEGAMPDFGDGVYWPEPEPVPTDIPKPTDVPVPTGTDVLYSQAVGSLTHESGEGEGMVIEIKEKAPWMSKHSDDITTVVIERGITSIGDYAFDLAYDLERVVLPEGLKSIGYHAFYQNYMLESVTIPSSVDTIADGAFMHCIGLKNIEFAGSCPKIDDGAFRGVTATVVVASWDLSWTFDLMRNYGGDLIWTSADIPPIDGSLKWTSSVYDSGVRKITFSGDGVVGSMAGDFSDSVVILDLQNETNLEKVMSDLDSADVLVCVPKATGLNQRKLQMEVDYSRYVKRGGNIYLQGDINQDGKINILDAGASVVAVLNGTDVGNKLPVYDVDDDGQIQVTDIVRLCRFSSGVSDSFS